MTSNRDLRHIDKDQVQDAFSKLVSGGKAGYKTVIEKKTEFITCKSCGAMLQGGENFCSNCGQATSPKNPIDN